MYYRPEIKEESFIKKAKIKKDLRKILKKHDFKRSFFTHPASEVYVKENSKARIYSTIKHDQGSQRHGVAPYDYEVVGVEVDGGLEKLDSKTMEELSDYFKKKYEKRDKKTKQKDTGLEKKFGIFAVFIIAGIALSISSLSTTGNAISNLSQTTPGLLGVFLFIAGLLGMFFYSRRK